MINQLLDKISQAKEIVYQAGEILMKYADDKEKIIHHKTALDLLTEADKESEELICSMLQEKFPEDSILSEEGFQYEGTSGNQWIVDPLDGTTSFAHDFPMFAVSMGLVDQNKQALIGLVYNPYFNELFHAVRGGGAFLNKNKISVSLVDSIARSLIGTGFPYNRREIMSKVLGRLEKILQHAHDIRRTGSASIDICFVAAGRYEGYYEQGLKAWDMAAAILIASEAGATISKFNGEQFNLFEGEILITNDKIHHRLIDLLGETIKK